MKIIDTVEEMHKASEALRRVGRTIAFVPTMGFLHEGHLALMRAAKKVADTLIVSIFVNPTQFGPTEDFDRYPRDTEGDFRKTENENAQIVFMPTPQIMYPNGYQTLVKVEKVTRHLCGLSRPEHFDGVTTVVTKLFNCVNPHYAVFGEKDFQQLTAIRRMVRDLNMPIQILGVPTVREPDGLAMSSRNAYLSETERASALSLKKSLDRAGEIFQEGTTDAGKIKTAVHEIIKSHPFTRIDYVSICDPHTLDELQFIDKEGLLALAVHVGKTRLIDNCLLRK